MAGSMDTDSPFDIESARFHEEILPLPSSPVPDYGFRNPLDAAAGCIEHFFDVKNGLQLRRGARVEVRHRRMLRPQQFVTADYVNYPTSVEFSLRSNWAEFFISTDKLLQLSVIDMEVVWARPQLIEWSARLQSRTLWAAYALFLRACYAQACLTIHPACSRCAAPTFGACRGIIPMGNTRTWCLTPVCSRCQRWFVGCPLCDPVQWCEEGAHSTGATTTV